MAEGAVLQLENSRWLEHGLTILDPAQYECHG